MFDHLVSRYQRLLVALTCAYQITIFFVPPLDTCIISCYINCMIQSTKGNLIEQVLNGKPGKGFPSGVFKVAVRKVSMVHAAATLEDLRVPPANRLEKLSGDRAGQHSIRINNQWRVCFVWGANGPENVEIVDYH